MKVEKIEILKITNEEEPETYYIIPSGYQNVDIRVYESGYEDLNVMFVNSDEWKYEKENLEIGF